MSNHYPPVVKRSELGTLRMVAGNEKRFTKGVVIDGKVKEWVGIGWITVRDAEEEDYLNLPRVEDGVDVPEELLS